MLRIFGGSFLIAIAGLAIAGVYGGSEGLFVVAVLALLEVSLSFDNAVVNAKVLGRMSLVWQRIFLTVGMAVAVFGMRLVFPVLLVSATAHLSPVETVRLAFDQGDPHTPGSYGYAIHDAHAAIAAFGGAFLLMLFLDFVLEDRELVWLAWLERPLQRIGRLDQLSVVIVLVALVFAATSLVDSGHTVDVLVAGVLGLISYLVVNSVTGILLGDDAASVATGSAGLALFIYLEVLDASFSFDGVVGAFAITADPLLIAVGLGVGAMFTRSLTIYLARREALSRFVFLEHGAMWAIGLLAVLLLASLRYEIPEVVTGAGSAGLIVAAVAGSVMRERRTSQLSQ